MHARTPSRRPTLIAAVVLAAGLPTLLAIVGGCDGCRSGVPAARPHDAGPPPLPTGIVLGVVELAPGAELPSEPEEPPDPRRPPHPPDVCPPPRHDDHQPVHLVQGDRLTGVLVTGSGFAHSPAFTKTVHEVRIEDCRLSPRMIVATRGDTLRITNRTDYPFLPTIGAGGGFLQAMLHDQTRDLPLDHPGVQDVTCGFAAPCGHTDLVVLMHPVHTVSTATGEFRLVAPVGALEVHAWHPLFRDASTNVTVRAGATVRAEIVLTPLPPRPPQPAPPPIQGHPEDQPGVLY